MTTIGAPIADTAAPRVRRKGKASAEPTTGYALLELEQLFESHHNPRRHFDEQALEELAESIRQVGLLQPILVRRSQGGYEVVCGARRYRAARLAGLVEVACEVRELTDEQLLEIRLVENIQRRDLDPLEEADAVDELRHRHGHEVVELAARLGRSETWVRQRLRLAVVGEDVRELVAAGTIGVAGALLFAQIDDELQVAAIQEITRHAKSGALSLVQVETILLRLTMELRRAPWNLDDANLSPEAGACSLCPHRSRAQMGLFEAGGVDPDDRCLARSCWTEKLKMHWKARKAEVKAAGGVVLKGEEAKKVLPYGSVHNVAHGFVNVDERAHVWDGRPDKHPKGTWRQVLKDLGAAAPTSVVQLGKDHVEVVKREDLGKAIKEHYPQTAQHFMPIKSSAPKVSAEEKAERKRQKEKERELKEAQRLLVEELLEKAAARSHQNSPIFRLVCLNYPPHFSSMRAVAERRGVKAKDLYEQIKAGPVAISDIDVRLVALELLVTDEWRMHSANSHFQIARDAYGLPALLLEEEDQVEVDEIPACRVCGCTEEDACEGGCGWVEDPEGGNLCSACLDEVMAAPMAQTKGVSQ